MLRSLRYTAEAAAMMLALSFFRLLPLDASSALAGWMARVVGPFLRAHKTAQRNIALAMPELSEEERRRVLVGMWDNLGRVIGEYPHLSRAVMRRRITVEGVEHLEKVRGLGKGAIFISGHFANWEIGPLTAALYHMPLMLVYRAANNPLADRIICRIRGCYNAAMYKKGREAAHASLKAIKAKQAVGMLIDQKMNDGEAVDFFGRKAMSATAAPAMAIRMQVPLLMARVVRMGGVRFHVIIEPPAFYDLHMDPADAMLEVNQTFERWIRQKPEQWFWVHRRWGK